MLSVSSTRASYRAGQLPTFDIQVVSTASQPCTFNVGRKYLALVITSRQVRVWSSADCVSGRGSQLASLIRGVPKVLSVSWPRTASAPGCRHSGGRVPHGSYTAFAAAGSLISRQETIRIG